MRITAEACVCVFFFHGEIKGIVYNRPFKYHPLLKKYINQEHDDANLYRLFPESIEQLVEKYFTMFLCEGCLTGSAYLM